jgi:hypothetical protein
MSGSTEEHSCDSRLLECIFNVERVVDLISVHMNDGLNLEGVLTGFSFLWDANLKLVIVYRIL